MAKAAANDEEEEEMRVKIKNEMMARLPSLATLNLYCRRVHLDLYSSVNNIEQTNSRIVLSNDNNDNADKDLGLHVCKPDKDVMGRLRTKVWPTTRRQGVSALVAFKHNRGVGGSQLFLAVKKKTIIDCDM